MARLNDPNSATSQFFINVRDNHRLDFGIGGAGYAVFGEVVQGIEIADRISLTPTTTRGQHENAPQTWVVIRTRASREVDAARARRPQAHPGRARPAEAHVAAAAVASSRARGSSYSWPQ
jgi:hypothetical protein